MNSYNDYMNSCVYEVCFMNSYMNSGVPRFQMVCHVVWVFRRGVKFVQVWTGGKLC